MSDSTDNKEILTKVVEHEQSKHFRYLRACGNVLLFRHKLLKRCLNIDAKGQIYRFVGGSYEVIHGELKDFLLETVFQGSKRNDRKTTPTRESQA